MTVIKEIRKDVSRIYEDGFTLERDSENITGLALLSLKLALKGYFSTYSTMKYSLHAFDKDFRDKYCEIVDIDKHSSSYVESSTEAILHLHHFAELVFKDILRAEHPLLADDIRNQPIILHKLIKGESLADGDRLKLKSIDFGEALKRLSSLAKGKRISEHSRYNFISDYEPFFEKLNELRNRLWHRGIYILRYPALDEFFGKYALPFIQNVTSLPDYSGNERFWKYQKLSCDIDPIKLIVKEFCETSDNPYNIGKIAMLKELGRAAYHQPQKIRDHGRTIGKKEYLPYVINAEHIKRAWRYTWQVVCMCCSFEVNHHLENPKKYSLNIEDFWFGEELT
jgi:hypothetical protein